MVTVNWLMNQMGFTISDERMADIPHPTLELTTHVTMKTTMTGAMLGSLVGGPITAMVKVSYHDNHNHDNDKYEFL